jgi:tRNA(Arg) A34 adenosine deaminase TadA
MKTKTRHALTAIIYDKKGRVLSMGQNSYVKTHPLQAEHAVKVGLDERIYLHAEVHAIVKCKDLSKAHKIFVSRWDKHGNSLLAKPCPVCESAIKAAGIKIVEHT